MMYIAFRSNDKVIGSFKNKVPEMYVSLLCRGMVLGESDIRVGKSKYTSNFTTVTDCSVYEMPMKIYQNCVRTYDKNRAKSLKVCSCVFLAIDFVTLMLIFLYDLQMTR